jgi:threonyl-tRNA synthetase
MLVLGEKEAQSGTVTVRKRTGGDQAVLPADELLAVVREQIRTRALSL